MSRSQPNENTPNPATRWHEWDAKNGEVRYYDKEKKETIKVGEKFSFILLDQLATVKGWHELSESGIFSNEVKDTRSDIMTVRSFKGGVLVAGVYKDIKDRVAAVGGQFVANCYIAFKVGETLTLGSIQFKGAALRAWMEFSKENRSALYKKAILIEGSTEGKKGSVKFKTPNFFMKEIKEETNTEATELDKELQVFLKGYFARTRNVIEESGDDDRWTDDEAADQEAAVQSKKAVKEESADDDLDF